MRLRKSFDDPCIRSLISRRLSSSRANIDSAVESLLDEDENDEFVTAQTDLNLLVLENVPHSELIENALNDYVLAMVLNEIFRIKNPYGFIFDKLTSGLLIENLAGAIITSVLPEGYYQRFIDTKGIDFAVFRKDGAMTAGIQCKALMDSGKSVLGARSLLNRLQKSSKTFKESPVNANVIFALFCGYVYHSRSKYDPYERNNERIKIKALFKDSAWPIFCVLNDPYTYEIDKSFKEFVYLIRDL